MARKGPLRNRDSAVSVSGLRELQAALRRADSTQKKELRDELKEAAEIVRTRARSNIPHATGRHGSHGERLGPSLKVSVTQAGASVWSGAPHSIVQDVGGRVGRGKATLLARADVSHYMSRAQQDSAADVERHVDAALAKMENAFERG